MPFCKSFAASFLGLKLMADKLLGALNVMRERVDELQRRVRGLEDLERRLAAVEKKVEKLSKTTAKAVGAKAADKPAD